MDRYNFTVNTVRWVTSYLSSHPEIAGTIQTGYSMSPLNYTDIPGTEAAMKLFAENVGSAAMNESILSARATKEYSHSSEWEAYTYDGNQSFFWPAKVVFGLINDSI